MRSFFDPDSPIMRGVAGFSELVVLNLLFLLCSLPVVTLGASAAALYTVTLRMVRQESGHPAKSFFAAFRSNFGKATALWLILLFVFAVGAADFILLDGQHAGLPVLAPLALLFLLWVFTAAYAFPLQARFENPVGVTLKNAFLLSFAHLPRTLGAAALNTLPLWLLLLSPSVFVLSSPLWLLVGCAGIAYLDSLLLHPVFQRYVPPAEGSEPPARDDPEQ